MYKVGVQSSLGAVLLPHVDAHKVATMLKPPRGVRGLGWYALIVGAISLAVMVASLVDVLMGSYSLDFGVAVAMIVALLLLGALGIWGVVVGVGMLRLCEWVPRVFIGFLVYWTMLGSLIVWGLLFVPLSSHVHVPMATLVLELAAVVTVFIVPHIFLGVYLMHPSTRTQFQKQT